MRFREQQSEWIGAWLAWFLAGNAVGADCRKTYAELIRGYVHHISLLQNAQTLGLPGTPMRKLLQRASAQELKDLDRIFDGLVKDKPVSLSDYQELAKILKAHRADGFFRFHGTVEGTIDKILTSRIDGRVQPHLRPGAYEWTVYALTTPPQESALGALRTVSQKSQGKETVVFQGQAASLFRSHPATGIILFYKWITGEKTVGMNRIVIDEYKRLADGTLVVTKAHLTPLSGGERFRAIIGVTAFHLPDILLAPVGLLCLIGC